MTSIWISGNFIEKVKRGDIVERAKTSDMVRIRYCRRLRWLCGRIIIERDDLAGQLKEPGAVIRYLERRRD